jgi:flavodoxin
MKRAIVFYSKTGNTESVVKRFKDFDILRVKASSDDPNQKVVELVERPDVKDYEEVIFACPVHGFMICKVMKTYLTELEDLSGKTIDLFVTHQFPVSWLGGNQTLKQMKKLIERKNGVVRNMTSINWSSKKKEIVIEEMLNRY